MKINKIEFRNINSYGNKKQTLTFDNKGSIILIKGPNGSGKSTIKQSIELSLFGKVLGKKEKKLALTKLPNRRNGGLFTGIEFENHKGDNIKMNRYIKPNDFEMFVNEEPYKDKYRLMSEKQREELIGYSFEVFKSFISLNINGFKDFISLSKEDKANLLNKLFNIDILDEYLNIVKSKERDNQKSIELCDNKIYENEYRIDEYRQTLINIKNKQKIDVESKLQELKSEILENKPRFDELKILIDECDTEMVKIKKKFSKLNILESGKEKEKNKLEVKLDNINEKIVHYESGSCPLCDTDLGDHDHILILEGLKDDRVKISKSITDVKTYLERCILEDAKLSNQNNNAYNTKSKYTEEYNELRNKLGILNNQYKTLKNQKEDTSVVNIQSNIDKLKLENNEYNETLINLNSKSDTYDELKAILSTNGVRLSMIKNIITPVNKYLNNFLIELNSEYKAVLDENFDATIYELDTLEIDPDTMSKGEDRKVNIAIALSYLKIVLDKKLSNIMFLDEIFDGLDTDNIDLVSNILKNLSREYDMNIIIVNHNNPRNDDFYDKIYETSKDVFSDIEIIK